MLGNEYKFSRIQHYNSSVTNTMSHALMEPFLNKDTRAYKLKNG